MKEGFTPREEPIDYNLKPVVDCTWPELARLGIELNQTLRDYDAGIISLSDQEPERIRTKIINVRNEIEKRMLI